MGAIQSSIGGVVSTTLGAAKKTTEYAEEIKKENIKSAKTDAMQQEKQNYVATNKVIDKAALANRIAVMHTEARITQSQAFKERLEAVRTGNWKASRTKLKRRGK